MAACTSGECSRTVCVVDEVVEEAPDVFRWWREERGAAGVVGATTYPILLFGEDPSELRHG